MSIPEDVSVGIVVAALNAEPYLAETLESIRGQTHEKWQCVIVDDGSTDATARVANTFVSEDPRFQLLRIPNQGLCVARNIGLARLGASVDAITCMDADDLWLPEALQVLITEILRRRDCIGCHALGTFIDTAGRPITSPSFEDFGRRRMTSRDGRLASWPVDGDTTFETLVTTSTVFPPGLVLMWQWVYQLIGGYDRRSVEGDWDLLIRATRHGSLAFIDRVILKYRRHPQNIGAQSRMRVLTHATRVRAFSSPHNTSEHVQILRSTWRAHQRTIMGAHRRSIRRASSFAQAAPALARLILAWTRWARGEPTQLAIRRSLSPARTASSHSLLPLGHLGPRAATGLRRRVSS